MNQHVIYIDANDLEYARTITIPKFLSNTTTTLIINVHGNIFNLANIDLSALGNIADKILWNFCYTNTLYINDIVVWGSILAPHTNIIGRIGAINGQVISKNFLDSIQVNWVKFNGCFNVIQDSAIVSTIEECKDSFFAGSSVSSAVTNTILSLINLFGLLIVTLMV